jgi:two-component system alkaline phosphatase synthesis response regulator PhoP
MANKTVLIVDDDVKTVELVKLYLGRDGYKVLTACDGPGAIQVYRQHRPNLIVLDLMLPGMDGLEVCRTLRDESDVPIIMLTARTTDEDKLTGLGSGADDYVSKPFSPRELAARVRTVLRRLPGERGPDEIKCGEICLNFNKQEVSVAGKPLVLTAVEFKLLAALVKEAGRVFTRADLIERALGYDYKGFDRTIDVHILNLRRKLEADPKHPKYIKTAYGAGYKFAGTRSDS